MAPRGVTIVSAFHTVSANLLSILGCEIDEDVLLAGDDRKSKDQVADLVRRIPGCGPSTAESEIAPPGAAHPAADLREQALKIKHSGIKLTGLPNKDNERPPSGEAPPD